MSDLRETPEDVAGRVVARVLKGEYTINDSGAEDAQYDVRVVTGEGRTVALEVTSFGGEDWRATKKAIEDSRKAGQFQGDGLRYLWWVVFPTGTRIRPREQQLTALLARLEEQGLSRATSRYVGSDESFQQIAADMTELGISSVDVLDESPPERQERITLSQSESGGTAGALPASSGLCSRSATTRRSSRKLTATSGTCTSSSKTTDPAPCWRACGRRPTARPTRLA